MAGWKSKLLSFGGKIVLIKHVLNSMPVHLLSVLNIPKGVISRLQKIFSNFLWGSSVENKKRKWISWKQICLLVEEGGLGIRAFHEVQESLLMKFAWKLIRGGSLWSDFFTSKYVGNNHIFSVMQGHRGSRFWRGLMALMPRVIHNSKWIIRGGDVNFWMDNWLVDGPLIELMLVIGNINLKVRDVVAETGPNSSHMRDLIPAETITKMRQADIRLR